MLLIFSLLCLVSSVKAAGVTYTFSGGRFGDNLISYLHAKWVAYRAGVPLLYKPFGYSGMLVMDEEEERFEGGATVTLRDWKDVVRKSERPYLPGCPCRAEGAVAVRGLPW